jgi:hypothetical protein
MGKHTKSSSDDFSNPSGFQLSGHPHFAKSYLNRYFGFITMGECPSGRIRMVHQNHEEKKNSSEFFECESRRAFGSSPVSSLMRLNTPKSVFG